MVFIYGAIVAFTAPNWLNFLCIMAPILVALIFARYLISMTAFGAIFDAVFLKPNREHMFL